MNNNYRVGDIVLGDWELKRLIGEGSYGRVFEAERQDFGQTYRAAIKIITIPRTQSEVANARSEGMDEHSVTAYFRSFVEEIVQEFELMSELKGTGTIVNYEDHRVIQHSNGIGWDIIIRMELLSPLLVDTQSRSLTKRDVLKLGIDICKALEICQRLSIIHRDIKPENIFVTKFGTYKLGDFGIARTAEKTTGMTKVGTPAYMAPEIYISQSYGPGVDIYSLGTVLYRLLNDNRVPFLPLYPAPITHSDREAAFTKRMRDAQMPPPKNASGRLAQIVLKACAYNPADRYASPADMRRDLESILHSPDEAVLMYLSEEVSIRGTRDASERSTAGFDRKGTGSIAVERGGPPTGQRGTVAVHADPDLSGDFTGKRTSYPPAELTQSVFDVPQEEADADHTQSVFEEIRGTIEGRQTVTSVAVEQEKPQRVATILQDEPRPETPRRVNPLSALWLLLLGHKKIAAAAVAALLLLMATLIIVPALSGKQPAGQQGMATEAHETTGPQATRPTTEAATEALSLSADVQWSDWTYELPADITSREYIVEEKLLYRYAAIVESDDAGLAASGNTLLGTTYGDYGGWSGWQTAAVSGSEIREVQTAARTQRCNLVSRTQVIPGPNSTTRTWMECTVCGTANTCYKNWTEYRYRTRSVVYRYAPNDGWSVFSEAPVSHSDAIVVSSTSVYRYTPKADAAPIQASMDNFPPEADYSGYFADINDSVWYAYFSGYATQLGAIVPDSYLSFRPEESITLAEILRAAVTLHRMYSGEQGVLTESALWYQVYVDYAITNGMLEANDFTDFTKPATRAEAAYILAAALPQAQLPAVNVVTAISDMEVSSKYYSRIILLAKAGVVEWPESDYHFSPDSEMTRAVAATLVTRLALPEKRVVN